MPTKRIKVISTVDVEYKGEWPQEDLEGIALWSVLVSEAASYSDRTYRVKKVGQEIAQDAASED